MIYSQKIKDIAKRLSNKILFNQHRKIVIASNGRAGSTMLYKAISESIVNDRFPNLKPSIIQSYIARLTTGFINKLSDAQEAPYLICKTHDVCDIQLDKSISYIFIYGDPLDSAMSVEKVVANKGIAWFHLHQFHLNAYGEFSDIYLKDVLNYEGQMKSWLSTIHENLYCVDYADLWNEENELSKFLQTRITLPKKQERSKKTLNTNINIELFAQLRSIKNNLKAQYLEKRKQAYNPDQAK